MSAINGRVAKVLGRIGLCVGLVAQAACAGSVVEAGGSQDAITSEDLSWSREAGLDTRFHAKILPYFLQHAKRAELAGKDGVPIRYAEMIAPQEKAAIVVFTGRTESYIKYAEFAYDLHRNGYSVYIIDHRGQGFSGRMLPDHDKGYVKEFSDYVTDAKTLIDTVVLPHQHARLFALAHSMGGAILGEYLLDRPQTFRAAVFSSPMFKIHFPLLTGGELGASIVAALGDPTDYAPTEGPYRTGRKNIYQHSPVRFNLLFDGLESEFPEIRLGGPTKGWVSQAIKGGRDIRDRASTLQPPMLLLQGELDEIVENDAEDSVCSAAKSCQRMVMRGSGHEVFMENDEIRNVAMDATRTFIDSH
jgi:lysophospholipase